MWTNNGCYLNLNVESNHSGVRFVPQLRQFSHDACGLLSVKFQNMLKAIKADAEKSVDVIRFGDAKFMAFPSQVKLQFVSDTGFDLRRSLARHRASTEHRFVFHLMLFKTLEI